MAYGGPGYLVKGVYLAADATFVEGGVYHQREFNRPMRATKILRKPLSAELLWYDDRFCKSQRCIIDRAEHDPGHEFYGDYEVTEVLFMTTGTFSVSNGIMGTALVGDLLFPLLYREEGKKAFKTFVVMYFLLKLNVLARRAKERICAVGGSGYVVAEEQFYRSAEEQFYRAALDAKRQRID